MANDSTISDCSANAQVSHLYCEAANQATRDFFDTLSGIEKGSSQWDTIVSSAIANESCIVKILGLREIGESGESRWLETLFHYSGVERNATVLSAILGAIVSLGGFSTVEERVALFHESDVCRRSAAFVLLDAMMPTEAVQVLTYVLASDPDVSLRREAAKRLAYLGSSVGTPELLNSLEGEEFHERVDAGCALAALGHVDGVRYVHSLLEGASTLQPVERSNLVFSLATCLHCCGVGVDQRDAQGHDPAVAVFHKASKWIDDKLSGLGSGCTG